MVGNSDSNVLASDDAANVEDGMIWLAGFALAFFVIALCFVSMGFLRTDLKRSGGAASTPSLTISSLQEENDGIAQTIAAPDTSQETGIVIVSRSVSDIFASMRGKPKTEKAKPAQPASEIKTAEIEEADAYVSRFTAAGVVLPRLKPAIRTTVRNASLAGQYVPMPIDRNAAWLADNIRLGFAHERDFTGGAERIFTASSDQAPVPDEPAGDKIRLKSGETLSEALTRLNIRAADRESAIRSLSGQVSVRALKPGTEIQVSLTKPEQTLYEEVALLGREDRQPGYYLNSLDLVLDDIRRAEVRRGAAGLFTTQVRVAETTTRYAAVSGTITDSLFASAARQGMPHRIAANLANMFLYDIDFQREIRYGDEFEAVYEVYYDDQGRAVGYGDIVYGRMSWRGGNEARGYYRFAGSDEATWFDANGESARRLLMKTPIEGARITSSFGMRKHPVLGYTKGHKGTDFGAGRGTPIMAAGDGVIQRANRFSTYGNYVKIKHAAGFETAYAHLNGFAKGIKAGTRVRQGDIIGYVGTTGRSTGPHLHYEVLKDGQHVNPMTIKVAMGRKLDGEELKSFQQERDWVDAMRGKIAPVTLAMK